MRYETRPDGGMRRGVRRRPGSPRFRPRSPPSPVRPPGRVLLIAGGSRGYLDARPTGLIRIPWSLPMRFRTSMLALAAAILPALAHAANYKVDTVHSAVVFRVKHMNTSYAYGRFN